MEEWAGLGYNRRALNLWRCALAVCEQHGGAFPDELDGLLALPGVGPYTARAVLAFAFERDVGVVDTNVGRVLARRAGRRLTAREVQAAADALVPPGAGWAHNQAMLDLGATVCVARRPACDRCPLLATCAWGRSGRHGPDPASAIGRRLGRPVPLRRLRPPGPGPPGGRVAASAPSPRPTSPPSWAGRPTPIGPRPSPPRSSPTASPCWPTGVTDCRDRRA